MPEFFTTYVYVTVSPTTSDVLSADFVSSSFGAALVLIVTSDGAEVISASAGDLAFAVAVFFTDPRSTSA